ncbi:ATP synthase subunit I [Thermotalea metallivorans]|uniref:ATP synthase I chain n=1 Tax=Thermotalea metallivorans TaxID=520762 RepID=A0A140L6T2_9FIRM|nr:ATP synthase subunit I [Thermotalea metallivorans]KXG76257.1 hypothetical protein AN619_12140 [Thermotalea metallivorans]
MDDTWNLQKKIVTYTLMVMSVIALGALWVSEEPKPFIYALVFGTLIGILNFRNLALTLEKAVTMDPAAAQIYASSKYFIRFFINAVVIFVSIKADYLNVLGTVIGLFLIKFAIVATSLFNKSALFKRNTEGKEEE